MAFERLNKRLAESVGSPQVKLTLEDGKTVSVNVDRIEDIQPLSNGLSIYLTTNNVIDAVGDTATIVFAITQALEFRKSQIDDKIAKFESSI